MDHPNLTPELRAFFEVELRNQEIIENEATDLADVPEATLSSALDSWCQAPDDILLGWCQILGTPETASLGTETCLRRAVENLARLIVVFGPIACLEDFV